MSTSPIAPEAFAAYQAFVVERQADFRRIAARTKGEHSAEDISQQALVTAYELQASKGLFMCFANPDYQKLLLGHLFQHFVCYTETTVRRALRYRRGQDDEDQLDLLAALPADDSCDPAHALDSIEASPADEYPDAQTSLASAYLFLVAGCNNEVRRLADRLLISRSHCYRRLTQARWLAHCQQPLTIRCVDRGGSPLQPRGWRRFRYERRPTQLQFAFLMEPTLWPSATAAPG